MKFTFGLIFLFAACFIFVNALPTPEENHNHNHNRDHDHDHENENENHQAEMSEPEAFADPNPLTEDPAAQRREALLRYLRAVNEAIDEYNRRLATEVEVHYPEKNEVHPHSR